MSNLFETEHLFVSIPDVSRRDNPELLPIDPLGRQLIAAKVDPSR
jgi:hypothetical protein